MLMLFFSFLRRWLCGLQRFLAGIIALYSLSQFEGFEEALFDPLFGYILLTVWAGFMIVSGSFLLVTNRPARMQSFWLAVLFLSAYSQFFGPDLVRTWLWPPVPVSTEMVGLAVWFMLPLSLYLCVLEIILPSQDRSTAPLTPARA